MLFVVGEPERRIGVRVEPTSTRRPSIAWSDQVAVFAIVELDRSGYVQSWNSGAERIKGYTREEIVGEHFSRFYRPKTASAVCRRGCSPRP